MAEEYSISDLAQEFGVTTRTIRYYEDQGLLSPRRNGVTRVFSSRDRGRLRLAIRSKRLGLSLAEIAELFELYDLSQSEPRQLEAFLGKLERRRTQLEQQRAELDIMLSEISFFTEQCRRLMRG